MHAVLRLAVAAGLAAALLAAAGCSEDERTPWRAAPPAQQVAPPPLATDPSPGDEESSSFFVSDDPRAGLPVPSVWRIEIQGTTSSGSGTTPIDLDGWLVVTEPYETNAASGNDVNIVDIGVKTDLSPYDGYAGALLFATNTGMSGALGMSAPIDESDVDVVNEWRDDDVVYAQVVPEVARVGYLNIYNYETSVAAQVHNVLLGTVSVRFSADGSTITGRIDLAGTSGTQAGTPSSAYNAAVTGVRYTG